ALYWIVNQFGVDANAAYSAAGRIDTFASMPAMSFAMALSTFVGQNIGADRPDRVKKGLRDTLLMSIGTSIVLSTIIVIFSRPLMKMFVSDPTVIAIGSEYLQIIGFTYVLFSVMFTINGLLRGAGDTLIPMFISLFSLWIIRIPVAWFLSHRTGLGLSGVWWAIPLGWMSGVVFYYAYYRTGNWKKKSVLRSQVTKS
ncbi:MAG TPA: MATE family efflux transporter, partial [Bacteroidales bacterium]|nr:MATE family efflux transporter [Bacteroidales bacterium]